MDIAAVEPWDQGPPKLNAPAVLGCGVGSETFLPLPATGARPLAFSAEGLPAGLRLDPERGVISGRAREVGESVTQITVSNAQGRHRTEIRVRAGDRLALTPPMGWNSWNCWGKFVRRGNIEAAARALVATGLAARGYVNVNIDDGWQGPRGGAFGGIQGNDKFPDMPGLGALVHGLGLRLGVYSTPWVTSYKGFTGGSEGEPLGEWSEHRKKWGQYFGSIPRHVEDARQFAAWGVDYLKYDWTPFSRERAEEMRAALRASGRDIVYSLVNGSPVLPPEEWTRLADLWRTTNDIEDTWDSVQGIGFAQDPWIPYHGPGHWNDPDMLVVGRLGWGEARESRLTPEEQATHLSLWALLAAPLLLGCDLDRLDDWTLRLLANEEVIAIDQDPLGIQARKVREIRRVSEAGATLGHQAVLARRLADGSRAVGLFNLGPETEEVEIPWADLGLPGGRRVRDAWARRDLGSFPDRIRLEVPSRGSRLLRVA